MPDISATPSAIAMPVRTARSLREKNPRSTTAASAERLHQVEHPVDVERRAVADDAPVGEHDQAVGVRGGVRVVGDHHDRLAELVDRAAQQREHLADAVESRLPVGSSANTTAGRETSARATATRCCWPPESSAGRWCRRSRMPTVSISRSNHSSSALAPGDRQRQQDVLARVEDRQQVEGLEDEADLLAPQQRQRAVVERRRARSPASVTVPDVGRSRPARRCISVDLPEPDGPMIAAKRAGAKSTLDARERVDRDLALAVAAGHPPALTIGPGAGAGLTLTALPPATLAAASRRRRPPAAPRRRLRRRAGARRRPRT